MASRQGRCLEVLEAEDTITVGRAVAHHDDVRLAAVQEAERDSGVRGVEERSLSLNDIPMIGRGIGAQHLGGSRDEVRYHGVDRDARRPQSGCRSDR